MSCSRILCIHETGHLEIVRTYRSVTGSREYRYMLGPVESGRVVRGFVELRRKLPRCCTHVRFMRWKKRQTISAHHSFAIGWPALLVCGELGAIETE